MYACDKPHKSQRGSSARPEHSPPAPPMFRLPTHLETLVPPPDEQVPQSQPWRGTFALPASSPMPQLPPRQREISVTAAETENDKYVPPCASPTLPLN